MRKKLRITLDTNVLISGLFWFGVSSKILEKCKQRCIELILSSDILVEFEETLQHEKKFEQTEKDVEEQLNDLMNISIIVYPREKIFKIKDDPADNVVLECAFAGNSDYIISGDKHLLKLKNYKEIKIVTPRQFIEILYSLG